MAKYFIVELDIQDQDVLTSLEQEAFESYGCTGSQEFSIEEAKVDEILGERSYSGGDLPLEVLEEVEAVLSGEGAIKKALYFSHETDAQAFLTRLEELNLANTASFSSEEVKDWNESWKQSFKRIPVTEALSVVPSWEKTEDDPKSIFIYPGMGFGTGNHETTFLCLKLMLEEIPDLAELKTCLDFGCGSGILGIGMAQVASKAERIDYLDIDQQALDNCLQNIELNTAAKTVAHKLLLRDQDDELQEGYDLLFANILLDALLGEAEIIVDKTQKYLVISGLLKGQEEEVIFAYTKMNPLMKLVKVAVKNDWSAALLRIDQ